jgi:sodium transport system ATP-binding protein
MLKVSGICKSFTPKKRMVLDHVSFDLNRGEAAALVGENGAGKTTLIRILSQIFKPDHGFFTLDGVRSDISSNDIKNKTGTLFSGDGGLYDRLSAEENIRYYADLNSISKAGYKRMLEILVNELSLSEFLHDRVSTFSRGMKQRTAIARTLITDPDFIILDEPSTGLDVIAAEAVKKIIYRLKQNGKTLLFSSHSTDEIFSCADRIIIIHNGKINCDKQRESYEALYGRDLTCFIKE